MTDNYEFELTLGDYSGDGHNQHETYNFATNKTKEEFLSIYAKSKESFDLTLVCADYEEDYLEEEHVQKLRDLGLNPENYCEEPDDEGKYKIWLDGFIDLFMDLLHVVNPSLEINQITLQRFPDSFGYGLFY